MYIFKFCLKLVQNRCKYIKKKPFFFSYNSNDGFGRVSGEQLSFAAPSEDEAEYPPGSYLKKGKVSRASHTEYARFISLHTAVTLTLTNNYKHKSIKASKEPIFVIVATVNCPILYIYKNNKWKENTF